MDHELVTEAVSRYANEYADYGEVAKKAEEQIRKIADAARIKCSVSARAKDPRSFHKKIIVKKYFENPYAQVTDKCGVRVVVESPRDVDRLCNALEVELGDQLVHIEDKRVILDPSRLGYSGVHVQTRTTSPTLGEVECEVQLRTAAQDAWSIVSHQILYKPILDLSPDMQHRAYRLVALVEMFDEEVQRLMDATETAPGSEVADLLAIAESAYLDLAHSYSNPELSVIVLQGIEGTFSGTERANYSDLLQAFIEAERGKLELLYRQYGPHSEVSYSPDYVLFGQAESVILLERINSKPHLLVAKWRQSGLPDSYLEGLAGAAGMSLPT